MKNSKDNPDRLLSAIVSEVRDRIIAISPVTKAEAEYQERSRQWMADMALTSDRANQLIAKGDLAAAQKLCDDFNATKPKRPVGRPRAVSPNYAMLNKVTLEMLLVEVVSALTAQQRSRIVDAAAREIIDRLA